MIRRFLCAVALAAVPVTGVSAHDASNDKSRVTLVYDQVLPNVPGKSIRGVLVEYERGGFSPAHTHPARTRELIGTIALLVFLTPALRQAGPASTAPAPVHDAS
jgi:hypothetical protein